MSHLNQFTLLPAWLHLVPILTTTPPEESMDQEVPPLDPVLEIISSATQQQTCTAVEIQSRLRMWNNLKTVQMLLAGLLCRQVPHSQQTEQVPSSWTPLLQLRIMRQAESLGGQSKVSNHTSSMLLSYLSKTCHYHQECLSHKSSRLKIPCHIHSFQALCIWTVPAIQGTAQRTLTLLLL